ncbi:MAG: transcription termination/antitermination factor NusG [Planctomycetes bacterium]|nr:transcription termination/antitermination factor NusG [Planctomycetota bacterium]
MEKKWFVLRVQSNKEEKVRDSLEEFSRVESLSDKIPKVLVPTEKISEIKGGKKRISERKLYPGYIMIEIEVDEQGNIPSDVWYLIRETPGTGDFVGGNRKPVPMAGYEVERMLLAAEHEEEQPKASINFREGDRVRIKEGPFENFDGAVEEILEASGRVRILLTIFGRTTSVELEYWQVEAV